MAKKTKSNIPKERWGVHVTHCCKRHGCKYGDVNCPVELGLVIQDGSCQDGREMGDICITPKDFDYKKTYKLAIAKLGILSDIELLEFIQNG
jgi:hypothetical protein